MIERGYLSEIILSFFLIIHIDHKPAIKFYFKNINFSTFYFFRINIYVYIYNSYVYIY